MTTTRYSRQNRDAGLRRVSAVTRWVVAGALAGTGLFAGLAAQSSAGSTAAGTRTPANRGTSSTGSSAAAATGDDSNGFNPGASVSPPLQPVLTLPSPSSGAASLVSGAS
jgi:hypothetical protein